MTTTLTRTAVAELSASRKIAQYDGQPVKVALQGAEFPGLLQADQDGTAVVVFDTPGIYFGESKVEIASHLYNNFTLHALDRLVIG